MPSGRGGEGGLRARFRVICDKRAVYNTLHSLESILAVAAFGTATVGGDTVTAISHWADDAPQEILAGLGCRRDPFTGRHYPPSERTLRRVLAQTDGDELDRQTCSYLAGGHDVRDLSAPGHGERAGERDGGDGREIPAELRVGQGCEREGRRAAQRTRERPRPAGMLEAGAADGKTVRGAGHGQASAPQLLSLLHHRRGVVLGQRQIADKTNEVPELAPLLADALCGSDVAVITADALHTARESARQISEDFGCYYVLVLKENQPSLLAAAQARLAPGTDADHERAGTGHTEADRGHGRIESRTIRTALAIGLDFPHAAQLFRIVRHVADLDGHGTSKEVAYGITNAPPDVAGPAHLSTYVRQHWSVENSEHYVRDRTFHEDDCQARTGQLPHVLATLRNLVISTFRQRGHVNIAHARRHYTHVPQRLLTLFTL
ncbi:ISAs1 family transposase [Streptosporangium album]|uniref:ISAs1 family transposase n=1 Tax=Streptosporangium album TaxID=47479 RepID=UPI00160728A5|nr:ISAs1 family transposase [Streptosporangium album]